MKKFYAFAAAASLAMSMSAQLYVVGSGDGLAWEPATPMTVELTADGVYSFSINNLTQFKISTAMGDWDTFNASAYVAEITEDLLGQAVALTPGDGNIGTPWKGDYNVVVASDCSTITLTTTTPKPTGATKIYLRGDMNNWLNDATEELMAQWEMASADGVTYWFDCTGETAITVAAGESVTFKIADADWDKINYGYGDELFPSDEAMIWNYNAENTVLTESYEGTICLVLPDVAKDPAMVTVYPEIREHAGVAAAIVAEDAPAEYFNLQGVRVANPENGLYIVRQGSKASKVYIRK